MTKLLLGAGARRAAGWTTVDISEAAHPDVVADARDLPYEDGTVEAIRAIDVLEHISYRDTGMALREWRRVLATGGRLFVQVPDAGTIMQWFCHADPRIVWIADTDGSRRQVSAIEGTEWRLLGGHADGRYASGDGWRYNAHYALFTAERLHDVLVDARFDVERIARNDHPNLLCDATAR